MGTRITRADIKAIETKIAEVERSTAGEIVVHVVEKSDAYPAVRLGWSVLLAAVTSEVLSYEFPEVFQSWSLEIAVGAGLLFWLLFGLSPILRWLVPASSKQVQVHRRALAAFVENRVHRTRDASGVLILVSLFERRVEILADEGIHARIGVEGWNTYIRRIIKDIKAGRPAAGIVTTIEQIGKELSVGVPPRPDDINELSNEVIMTTR